MPVTSTDIANQAVMLMGGNQPLVTGVAPNFDDSTVGKALKYLYAPCVQTVARQFEYDFARKQDALALSGNAPPVGWDFEYLYPAGAVEIWQVMPPTIDDPNNPLPTNWTVGNTLVNSTQTKVIWSNQEDALAVYNSNPSENTWDATFREAVVRLLASELATATAGQPETATLLLQSGSAFQSTAETRDG